jgi:(E)-4-hydroxy-3-methyl-but-2-enyl pyrophosphate reductase/ribosomal protein S1
LEEQNVEVFVAKTAGFCFGVKRAVEKVYEQVGQDSVYTYGPIIHNETVVKDLESKGVHVLNTLEELEQLTNGTVIIRSHGVEKKIYDRLEQKGINIVDATCPFVRKIHKIVHEESNQGNVIVIVGNPSHPEVEGIRGWAENDVYIVENTEDAENVLLPSDRNISVVSQTTFNYNKFEEIVEILNKKYYNIKVHRTICNATEERQHEAGVLASEVDAMVVIGGQNSSNTQKLYEISRTACDNTYFIQTVDDLDLNRMKTFRRVGITAGASTPSNIIKEVHGNMSEKSFEELLEESLVTIRNGEVVNGKVIDVKEDEIVLNIGYKADGIITRSEYTNTPGVDLRDEVKVGDTMDAKVLKVNDGEGQVLLTYKRLLAEKGNQRLEEAFENKEVLTATVASVVNGGLSVVVDEAKVFIPASLVSDVYEKDLSKYAGQEIQFVISEFNPRKRRVIGDRKQLIVAEKLEKQRALLEKINVGDTVEGIVKNITDFGAFIDLGGSDGLLHISEMSWGRVESPKKVFTVGQTVKVLIKDINETKIALSLKFPEENPWLNAEEKFAVGNIVTGTVARMTDFGAFVEIQPGVDALLHVSQIARERIEKPSDVLKLGEEIEAKIVDFKLEDKKISLSRKVLLPEAAPAEEVVAEEVEAVVEEAAAEE